MSELDLICFGFCSLLDPRLDSICHTPMNVEEQRKENHMSLTRIGWFIDNDFCSQSNAQFDATMFWLLHSVFSLSYPITLSTQTVRLSYRLGLSETGCSSLWAPVCSALGGWSPNMQCQRTLNVFIYRLKWCSLAVSQNTKCTSIFSKLLVH